MSKIRNFCNDKDFFDGALACDDDQIQAHKLIISACMHYLLINCIFQPKKISDQILFPNLNFFRPKKNFRQKKNSDNFFSN